METTLLRGLLSSQLPGTGSWLFTDEALQQASAGAVASHRAKRCAGASIHDVTCSIGTELAALRGSAARVSAVTSTRCGWRWRNTTSARPSRSVPRRRTASGDP